MKILLAVDVQKEFRDQDGQYDRIVSYIKNAAGKYDRI